MRPLDFGMNDRDDFENDFDARLFSAFAESEAEIVDDGFSDEVLQRVGKPDRRRYLMLGGAGSTGAAFAATQLEVVFRMLPEASGWIGQAQAVAGPQTMAAAVMAMMVASFAFMVPKRL